MLDANIGRHHWLWLDSHCMSVDRWQWSTFSSAVGRSSLDVRTSNSQWKVPAGSYLQRLEMQLKFKFPATCYPGTSWSKVLHKMFQFSEFQLTLHAICPVTKAHLFMYIACVASKHHRVKRGKTTVMMDFLMKPVWKNMLNLITQTVTHGLMIIQ